MSKRVVAIIQARMGSSRLPGKVLMELAGEPMLARVVNRARRATTLDEVVVATSHEAQDGAIVALCEQKGWPVSRGSQEDVLDRYYQAAQAHQAQVVVRLTSDCPLIEPALINQLVSCFLADRSLDYVSNTLPPRTFPRGLDGEVFSFEALERAWHADHDPASREHVTPFLYRNPALFTCKGIASPTDLSTHRWTVDTPEDLALVRRIYDHFGHDRFDWLEVVALLEENPAWLELNQHIEQKKVG